MSAAISARLRRALPLIALGAGLVAAVLVAGPPGASGPPLDPASTGPLGTKALVDTLRELGATVTVTDEVPASASPQPGSVLLLSDDLTPEQRTALEGFVLNGGTVVITDPLSSLTPRIAGSTRVGLVDPTIGRDCAVAALAQVQRVAAQAGAVYQVPEGGTGCFPRGDGHWLVIEPRGEGVVVSLGSPEAWVNASLGRSDNAVLAVALLSPTAGANVTFLRPPLPGEGDTTLADLIDPRVWGALAQLGVAFLVVALWRGRRLGRPVAETQPVALPGSELVVAVGNLLHQSRARAQAAALLRDDLRRILARRLGLPPSSDVDDVAAAADRVGLDGADVRDTLGGPAPDSEEALVAFARHVETLRRSVAAEVPVDEEPEHKEQAVV